MVIDFNARYGYLYGLWKFSDFVRKKPDGTYKLKEERKHQLNDKVRHMREQAETYYLLA